MELFRPFTTTLAFPSPHSTPLRNAKLPVEPATSASISASQHIRHLLLIINSSYARSQTPFAFAQIGVAVAFETLPFVHTLSTNSSEDASIAFIAALRLLSKMDRIFVLLRFALLGIKQAAARTQYALPSEAQAILMNAEHERPDKDGQRMLQAGWVFDLSQAGTNAHAARLDNVIRELDALAFFKAVR